MELNQGCEYMPWFNVKVDRSELNRLMKDISAWDGKKRMAVETILKSSSKDIQKQAKLRVPVRSGKLKSTVKQKFSAPKMQAMVFSNLQYAHIVEFGARAHTIRPKKKKVLRIPKDGGYVFAKEVNVPKLTAKPFMKPAYEYEEHHIIRNLRKALNKDEKIT